MPTTTLFLGPNICHEYGISRKQVAHLAGKHAETAGGMMNTGFGMAGMISPAVFGFLIQTTGSYKGLFLMFGCRSRAHGMRPVSTCCPTSSRVAWDWFNGFEHDTSRPARNPGWLSDSSRAPPCNL